MIPPQCQAPNRPLAELAAAIGRDCELVAAAEQVRRRRANVLGLLLRALTREEVAVLESAGCRANDWARVQVAQDFDCFRLRRTSFQGDCIVGRCAGEIEVEPGIKVPCGITDSTLIDCQIGNDVLIENVRFMAHVVVEREAVVFDVGSLTCSGKTAFGCGTRLTTCIETGGRELPVWAELTVDDAAAIISGRGDRAGQQAVTTAVDAYTEQIRSPVAWVRRGARIRHVRQLRDVYLGAHAVIDHALEVIDCAVLSSAEEPAQIGSGAAISSSVIQWGCHVGGDAIVRRSILCEHSGADAHATIEDSVIGPNSHIAKGEVTASLVGPFVGFHHQSLLIAAYWPEGKGNIAYGAMVGSNHTGRAPDQEVWPGEGVFFGLGCAIRFPADYSEAPYSTISMGVSTLPQKVRFPFSLISVPIEGLPADSEVPRAYNEIVPAWGLYANAYGLVRNELKFAKRDRARRQKIDYKVLRPRIMRLVKQALDRLKAPIVAKAVYLEADIDGLGRNFLREESRIKAIETYELALTRYSLRLLLNEREGRLEIPGSAEIAHELADALLPGLTFAVRMARLLEIERANAALVQDSKVRDDERGVRIIPGYADAHVPAADDPVVRSAWDRVRRTEDRVAKAIA